MSTYKKSRHNKFIYVMFAQGFLLIIFFVLGGVFPLRYERNIYIDRASIEENIIAELGVEKKYTVGNIVSLLSNIIKKETFIEGLMSRIRQNKKFRCMSEDDVQLRLFDERDEYLQGAGKKLVISLVTGCSEEIDSFDDVLLPYVNELLIGHIFEYAKGQFAVTEILLRKRLAYINAAEDELAQKRIDVLNTYIENNPEVSNMNEIINKHRHVISNNQADSIDYNGQPESVYGAKNEISYITALKHEGANFSAEAITIIKRIKKYELFEYNLQEHSILHAAFSETKAKVRKLAFFALGLTVLLLQFFIHKAYIKLRD